MNGHFGRAETEPKRYLAEVRVEDPSAFQLGQEISVELFSKGDRVDISGNSKGKGFAGVIKRHNFAGGPGSHGSRFHRSVGSIGSRKPRRVFKGKRIPG